MVSVQTLNSVFKGTDTVEWLLWVEKQRQAASCDHSVWRKKSGYDASVALWSILRYCNKQPHLPHAVKQRTNATSHRWPANAGAYQHQCKYSENTGHWATIKSESCCLKIGHRGIQREKLFWCSRTGQETLSESSEKLIKLLLWPQW